MQLVDNAFKQMLYGTLDAVKRSRTTQLTFLLILILNHKHATNISRIITTMSSFILVNLTKNHDNSFKRTRHH